MSEVLTRHVHIETILDRRDARVNRAPIGHDVALEAKFFLEKTVLGLRVFASVASVQPLVGAHEAGSPGMNSVGERPKVDLVHGTVIDVGRQSFKFDIRDGTVHLVGGVTLSLLFVSDEVLGGGLDTGILVTIDGQLHGHTGQIGIGSKAFPIPTGVTTSAERSSDGGESYVSALGLELFTHGVAALIEHLLVPCGSDGNARGEDARIISHTNGKRAIVEAETSEVEPLDGKDIADTSVLVSIVSAKCGGYGERTVLQHR